MNLDKIIQKFKDFDDLCKLPIDDPRRKESTLPGFSFEELVEIYLLDYYHRKVSGLTDDGDYLGDNYTYTYEYGSFGFYLDWMKYLHHAQAAHPDILHVSLKIFTETGRMFEYYDGMGSYSSRQRFTWDAKSHIDILYNLESEGFYEDRVKNITEFQLKNDLI